SLSTLGRRGDVEQPDLVGALQVVGPRGFHGDAGVSQASEVDALHHATVLDVQAGNDATLQHLAKASSTVKAPSYSARPSTTPAMPAAAQASRCASDPTPPLA